jgi:hypothetical protein
MNHFWFFQRHSKRQHHRSKASSKQLKQNQRSHRHHSSVESLPSTSSKFFQTYTDQNINYLFATI